MSRFDRDLEELVRRWDASNPFNQKVRGSQRRRKSMSFRDRKSRRHTNAY